MAFLYLKQRRRDLLPLLLLFFWRADHEAMCTVFYVYEGLASLFLVTWSRVSHYLISRAAIPNELPDVFEDFAPGKIPMNEVLYHKVIFLLRRFTFKCFTIRIRRIITCLVTQSCGNYFCHRIVDINSCSYTITNHHLDIHASTLI